MCFLDISNQNKLRKQKDVKKYITTLFL